MKIYQNIVQSVICHCAEKTKEKTHQYRSCARTMDSPESDDITLLNLSLAIIAAIGGGVRKKKYAVYPSNSSIYQSINTEINTEINTCMHRQTNNNIDIMHISSAGTDGIVRSAHQDHHIRTQEAYTMGIRKHLALRVHCRICRHATGVHSGTGAHPRTDQAVLGGNHLERGMGHSHPLCHCVEYVTACRSFGGSLECSSSCC